MHHCCPHHADALARHRVDSVDTWRCDRCEGLWLPGAIVARVVDDAARWPTRAETRETALRCPDDGAGLRALDHRGIEIDLCPCCHGVWLDRGELVQILARREDDGADDGFGAEVREEIAGELIETGVDAVLEAPLEHLHELVDVTAQPLRNISRGLSRMRDAQDPPPPSIALRSDAVTRDVEFDPRKFDVEFDPRKIDVEAPSAPVPAVSSFKANAAPDAVDASLFADAAQSAVDGLSAVFEFIGEAFSDL